MDSGGSGFQYILLRSGMKIAVCATSKQVNEQCSLNLSSTADACQRSDEQNTGVSNRIYEPSPPTVLVALHQQLLLMLLVNKSLLFAWTT